MVPQAILLPEGPHIGEEGLSTPMKMFFWGEIKFHGGTIFLNENGQFEVEIEKNCRLHCFQVAPFDGSHFSTVGSARGQHFDP